MMNSFTQTLEQLSSAQKNKRGVSLYSRFINRPLGRVLAAICYRLGMTPNQVTAVSAAVTAAGLVVLVTASPSLPRAIGVAALLALGFAFDSADGQVARLSGGGSPSGEWLDHVIDAGKVVAVHAAVLITVYRYVPLPEWWLLIPLGFQVVSVVTFAGGVLVELLARANRALKSSTPSTAAPSTAAPSADASPVDAPPTDAPQSISLASQSTPDTGTPSLVRAIGLLPADYGILCLSFILMAWPTVFIPVYSALFVANTLIMALLLVKWFRILKRGSGA